MEFVVIGVLIAALVFGQSLYFRKRALSSLDYSCHYDTDEVFEGETLGLIETVANRKLLPLPWLKAEFTTTKWLDFADTHSTVTDQSRFVSSIFLLKSFQQISRTWRVTAVKRGIYSMNQVALVASDLLGQSIVSRPASIHAALTVLPRPAQLEDLFVSASHLQGDVLLKRNVLQDPFYVSGVREYTPRDTMNQINWNATARQGKIMVRNNDYTTSQNITLLLNIQSRDGESGQALDEETVENAIRVSAALLEHAALSGIPVRLGVNSVPGQTRGVLLTEKSYGRNHWMSLLRLLAALELKSTETFDVFLSKMQTNAGSDDLVVVTAYVSKPMADFAAEMLARGRKVTFYVIDILENIPFPAGCEVYGLYRPLNERETKEAAV